MEQLRPEIPIENIPVQTIPVTLNLNTPPVMESHSKEFSIGEMKEEQGKIKIDFLASENPNSFIKAPTEPAKPTLPGSGTSYINPATSPNSATNPLSAVKSKEEIRGSMNTLISILDYALSFLGLWIAGEGTQTQYTADTTQKKLLGDALTDYFYEKQIKMSPFFALILAFLGAYGFMLVKAGKTRFDKRKNLKPKLEKSKDTWPNWPSEGPSRVPVKENDFKPSQKTELVQKLQESIVESKKDFKWLKPDEKIIAASNQDVQSYVKRGIYPMWIKSKKTGKMRKIKYIPETGQPVLIGKPERIS